MTERVVFFATCAPGVEPVLHDEVRTLKVGKVERQVGGVRFTGALQDAWRANLWLRTAIRVLMRLSRFPAPDGDALYAGVREVDWRRFVHPEGTLVVDAQVRQSKIDHSQFVAQRVKDAIVDQLRERTGVRPSVDKEAPDLRVHLHLYRDRATLSVDTSGASLHKRGWRRYQGFAPLSETLAAAIVMLAGWDRRAPLIDPFCGSGTLLVEAASWALDLAPGRLRRFGFERWPGHDAAHYARLRRAAEAAPRRPSKAVLLGTDRDGRHVRGAHENLAAAGVEDLVRIETGDARDLAPRRGWNGYVVTNPPFGDRVGDRRGALRLHEKFGAVLRARCQGYWTAVLSSQPELLDALALPACERIPLGHGGLDCELLRGRIPAAGQV